MAARKSMSSRHWLMDSALEPPMRNLKIEKAGYEISPDDVVSDGQADGSVKLKMAPPAALFFALI